MPDGRENMIEVVKAALDFPVNEARFGDRSKKAAIVVEALIAESGGYDHIMRVRGWDFIIQHPITERFDTEQLFSCPIFHKIQDHMIVNEPIDGDYRITLNGQYGVVVERV